MQSWGREESEELSQIMVDSFLEMCFNLIMTEKMKKDRLNRTDEALFIELFESGFTDGPIVFGRFLKAKGLITDEDIFNARMLQKRQNRKIGEIAVDRGLMDMNSVERLLVYQEETGIRFGELAVQLGYLSQKQVEELLEHMEKSYIYFGEALVRIGILDGPRMKASLELFHRLRVRLQQMDV